MVIISFDQLLNMISIDLSSVRGGTNQLKFLKKIYLNRFDGDKIVVVFA